MMKGPGGAQHAEKDAPPESVIELMPSLERLNKELATEIKEGKLEVRLEPRGLVISLKQSAFFSSGTDAMDESNLPSMKKLAELIATLPNSIQLEGHTDSIPIHNDRFKSNWELSCARAIAVLETFCGTFQLNRQRFSVVGRADTVPIDSNETPEGRGRNRRVDVVILNSLRIQGLDANKLDANKLDANKKDAFRK
jgi:chemotaxis protein MotB